MTHIYKENAFLMNTIEITRSVGFTIHPNKLSATPS